MDEAVKTHILRWDKEVVFQHLCIPHIPCSLDYFQVLFSLCEILTQLYQRMGSDKSGSSQLFVFEAMKKLDAKVKHHLLNVVGKELTKSAHELLDKAINSFCEIPTLDASHADTKPRNLSVDAAVDTHLVLPSHTM